MNCEVMLCPRYGYDPLACLESHCQWETKRSCGEPAVAIVGSTDPQIEYQSPQCCVHLPEKMQDCGNVPEQIVESARGTK